LSNHHFKSNDLLLALVPKLLIQFPTIQEFEKEYDMIIKILIENLPAQKAEFWKKSEDNLGVHDKPQEENFAKQRKLIKQTLGRQMRKLEEHMFLKPILDTIIEEEELDEPGFIETVTEETAADKSITGGKRRKVTCTKSVRIAKNYDGRKLIGRRVCKFFPKIHGSTHKPAFYDGQIVDYDAE
jgi:hypothetical protein